MLPYMKNQYYLEEQNRVTGEYAHKRQNLQAFAKFRPYCRWSRPGLALYEDDCTI